MIICPIKSPGPSARFVSSGLLSLITITILLFWGAPLHAGCISQAGTNYILVKTTFNSYIYVAQPDCSKDHTKDVVALAFTLPPSFSPSPLVTIWSGSGDPNAHTAQPVTVGLLPVIGDPPGLNWPFSVTTYSLLDLGTYAYQVDGGYCVLDAYGYCIPGTAGYFESDYYAVLIGNSPPTASLSVSGNKKVGNNLTFNANGHDNDPGTLHYNWSVAARPALQCRQSI